MPIAFQHLKSRLFHFADSFSTLRIALSAFALLISVPGQSNTLIHMPAGQDINYAGASFPSTVQTANNNPASISHRTQEGLWFGMGSLSAGYEFSDVDDLMSRIEELTDDLGRTDLGPIEAAEIQQAGNILLEDIGDNGYVRLSAVAQPPFLPLGGKALGGHFHVGLTGLFGSQIKVLDAPVEIVDLPDESFELTSDSAGFIRYALGTSLSLGYSRTFQFNDNQSLSTAIRLNHYSMELAKGVIALENSESGEELEDDLRDEFRRNRRTDRAQGVDLGVLWTNTNYRLGATLKNLNEPSLRYPTLGENCGDPARSPLSRANCESALLFADRVGLRETHRMETQLQLEAAVFSSKNNAEVSLRYDANAVDDLFGDEQQWLSLTGTLRRGWFIPGLRGGYHKNLSGTGLSYLSAGFSLFKLMHLDIAMATNSVDNDGSSVPRGGMIGLSFERSL